jgi:hypothetical protein
MELVTTNMVLRPKHTVNAKCFEHLSIHRSKVIDYQLIDGIWRVHVTTNLIWNIISTIHENAKNADKKMRKSCVDQWLSIDQLILQTKLALPKATKIQNKANEFFKGEDWTNVEERVKAHQIAEDTKRLNLLLTDKCSKAHSMYVPHLERLMECYPDLDLSSLRDNPDWHWEFRLLDCLYRPKRQRTN